MCDGYYGKITNDVYAAALQFRGDDDTCWEERVPLADPRRILGPQFPEDWFGDEVIAIWEAAYTEAAKKYGKGCYVLESVTLFLQDNQNSSTTGEMVWQSNARQCK